MISMISFRRAAVLQTHVLHAPVHKACSKRLFLASRAHIFAQIFNFRSNYFRVARKIGLRNLIKRHMNFVIPHICVWRFARPQQFPDIPC
jgi:hypothetical protein